MTVLELVIATAIMGIVLGTVLPLFVAIRNSWDSKAGNSETLQNGRVLTEHMHRHLSTARKITAVSSPSEVRGHIEFEDSNEQTLRYDIAGDGYVEFGTVGDASELAGPVSQLQFTCCDACDLDTPSTDVNSIRFVEITTTVINSASLGQDRSYTTSAYLRARSDSGTDESLTAGALLEYDVSQGTTPALAQVDSTHFLCVYAGPGSVGRAVILAVDTDDWTVSRATAFEFDSMVEQMRPALAKIDNGHYLCIYADKFDDGQAVVLTVDTGTWEITKETPLEYDTDHAGTPALAKIDDGHYLCAYADKFDDGQAMVLTVDAGDWTISGGTKFEYDDTQAQDAALAQIDATHYLCAYTGTLADGWALVMTVHTGTWTVSGGPRFEFDGSDGKSPALSQIDSSRYLCAYTGLGFDGWATVLVVDPNTWTVGGLGTRIEFDTTQGMWPALARIDPNNHLCVYEDSDSDGKAVVLTYDPAMVLPIRP